MSSKLKKFSAKFSLKPRPNFIPTLFTAVGVIMVWRGMWYFLDLYLFPQQPFVSGAASIIIGLVILYLPEGKIENLF